MAKNIFTMNVVNTLAVFVVFLSFVALSNQQQQQQQQANNTGYLNHMHYAHEECVKESGVDQELTRKAVKDNVFTEDPKLKCYFKCIYQKMGRMDSNGNIDLSHAEDHIPDQVDKTNIVAALNKCKNNKGSDACDTAFKFAKCFREAVGLMKPTH